MAISIVQSNSSGAGGTPNQSIAFTSNNTAGNLLVAVINGPTANPTSVTDTAGNNWVLLGSINGRFLSTYYVLSAKGGANTVTVNNSGSVAQSVGIIEVSQGAGSGLVWTVDGTYNPINLSGAAGSAVTSNPITIAKSNNILISQVGVVGSTTITVTPTGGFSSQQASYANSSDNVEMQTRIVSASGSYTSTATLSAATNFWDVDISSFAAVPPSVVKPAPFLLDVYYASGMIT